MKIKEELENLKNNFEIFQQKQPKITTTPLWAFKALLSILIIYFSHENN